MSRAAEGLQPHFTLRVAPLRGDVVRVWDAGVLHGGDGPVGGSGADSVVEVEADGLPTLHLRTGVTWLFKYVIDGGLWAHDPSTANVADDNGVVNNTIRL